MAARFKKVLTGPLGDFDGWDEQGGYQMVPTGGELRFLGASGGALGGTITNGRPDLVRMERFKSSIPLTTARIDQAILPPNAEVEFALNGLAAPGRTTLSLTSPAGKLDDSLTISIKTPQPVKLSVVILGDIRRRAGFDAGIVRRFLSGVAKTYKQQANIDLTIINGPEDILVEKDLKDPIFPEKIEIENAIHDATPKTFFLADVIVYCTWNMKSVSVTGRLDLAGLNIAKKVFIENNPNPNLTAITFAHEIGHALGLDHIVDKEAVMNPIVDGGHSRFRQFEIDHINPSGV
jgi:hypothetical protein